MEIMEGVEREQKWRTEREQREEGRSTFRNYPAAAR